MPESKRQEGDNESLIGATINGRYRIVSLIARGGMGKVYKAEQSALGRVCALKVLSPHYEGDKDPEFHRRFSLEASTAAKLTHPNTVTIFDYGKCEEHGVYYIAMEYLDGRTLHRVLHDEHVVDEARARHIAQQVCRSVSEAHKHGIVHRDLKPSNVMLLDRGDELDFVKVLDFGLVKDVTGTAEELTQTGLFMGSPKYMAPEQVLGTGVSPRTDVYAVGVIMYEMLVGKVPFDRKAGMSTLVAHVNEKVPPMREKNPDVVVSPEMEAVIMRCLEKEPEKRFASMRDLYIALKRAGGDLTETQEGLPRVRLEGMGAPSGGTFSGEITGSTSGVGSGPRTEGVRSVPPPSGTLRSPITIPAPSSSGALPPPPPVPGDSLSPPSQGSRSFTGSLPSTTAPSWRPYALALAASVLGGGTAALVLSKRGDATSSIPSASASAPVAVAIALPASAAAPPAGPGVRIVTVKSDPSGAGVSDQGVEVCMATPCRVYWVGAAANAPHELKLSKKGFRSVSVPVASGQEEVMGKLDPVVPDVTAVAPPPAAAPDPYSGARSDPTPSATASAAPVAAPPPTPPPPTQTATAEASPPPAATPTATAAAPPPTNEVQHLDESTTRPTRVSGAQPVYPREAMAAKVQGTVVAKCVITTTGSVTGCRIVKGLPFMDGPVLSALSGWKYTPATRDGKPVSVDMPITLKIVPP
jgi:serine/threonine-protein kinase